MAPNLSSLFLTEASSAEPVQIISSKSDIHSYQKNYQPPKKPAVVSKSRRPQYKWDIVWGNVFIFLFLHTTGVYGFFLMLFRAKWSTFFFAIWYASTCAMGVTAGAHRLWAHRTYKARLPLRILLMILQSASLQNDIYEWVRDHRVHHKFTDTDADPHNSSRGFFFSHVGWLMVKKHPQVIIKGKTVDMSDVEADPVVRFQRKFYIPLVALLTFIIPSLIPYYLWNENWWITWLVTIGRYTASLNFTWLVNSAAHIWGTKPYDKNINPTENKFVAVAAFGEGWHNYHHVFPWDYKAAELGNYRLNLSTAFLDFMAYIGQAYDLKTVSEEMVKRRVKRTGDGTWTEKQNGDAKQDIGHRHEYGEYVWGWGDKDMKEDDIRDVEVYSRKEN